jgi:hypothetical protein
LSQALQMTVSKNPSALSDGLSLTSYQTCAFFPVDGHRYVKVGMTGAPATGGSTTISQSPTPAEAKPMMRSKLTGRAGDCWSKRTILEFTIQRISLDLHAVKMDRFISQLP